MMSSSNSIKQNKILNTNFVKKMELCKDNSCLYPFNSIKNSIINGDSLIEITKKYLDTFNYKQNVCYELFEAFYMFKNNMTLNYKLARYLKHCVGILGSGWYFDENHKFIVVFFSVKDIIKELDGDEFFIWLNDMCKYNYVC